VPLEIHLVSHTHWDREWYQPAEVFRQRLVALIDELIDSPPRQGESFLLDGQTIVLDDYLAVRPERRDSLAALLRDQRIEAGPWLVLPDELIPGGEALVRNLLAGRRGLQLLGASAPAVLYCPDSFGHPATLPELAAGFGLPLIILWRGYGGSKAPRGDVVRWKAPSGADALLFHLPPDGYEFGSSLPLDADASRERWTRMRALLATRSTVGVGLLLNGADHHARQARRDEAVDLLRRAAESSSDQLRASSLRTFSDAIVKRAASQRVQSVAGELRDSYGYTWTLQGTFGTRAGQKRANARAERALVREAEPWSALAWFAGKPSRLSLTQAAWGTLLTAHPHDTLCGTSIDEVARAMETRIRSARAQAGAIRNASIDDLLGRDLDREREQRDAWQPSVVLRNESAFARSGVAIVDLVETIADEPVGPGSGEGPRIEKLREKAGKPAIPKGAQLLETSIARERLESPRHYPDNDIVRVTTIAMTADGLPAMSLTPLGWPVVPGAVAESVHVSATEISAGTTRCRFTKGGMIAVEGPTKVRGILTFEDRVDRGDLYTPSLGRALQKPKFVRSQAVHRGPLLGEVKSQWTIQGGGTMELSCRLTSGSPLIVLDLNGVNETTDHRLRIGIGTGVSRPTIVADAAFGPVERLPLSISSADQKMESAPSTAPLHRFVSLFGKSSGATVFSDGLAEYEIGDDGTVWITLVRSVGTLSRNDLPERPGHAGWPVATPEAQCLGRFTGRFALYLHGSRSAATMDAIEREADQFLLPLRGFTVRSGVSPLHAVRGPELSGTNLAFSACKQSEDGQWLTLRCVNIGDREQKGRWTLPRSVNEAKLARLDETPIKDANIVGGSSVEFTAGPRSVTTILVR
jgi:alpha-mannosidase